MRSTKKGIARVLCMLVCMLMITVSVIGCTENKPSADPISDESGSVSDGVSTDATESGEAPVDTANTDISNYSLSDFQIVYSYEATANEITAVYDLKKLIKEVTGVSLKTRSDDPEQKKLACEILIGKVDREEAAAFDSVADGEYIIRTVPTADGVKLLIGGKSEYAVVEAIAAFSTMLQENKVFDEALTILSLNVTTDYLSKYASYHIEVSEPRVIAQGEYTSENLSKTWGFMQFPAMSRLTDGSIYISWSLRPDTIDAYEGPGGDNAVSDDNGLTWHDPYGATVSARGVEMSNGKIFKGFIGEEVFVADYTDAYIPLVEIPRRGITLYLAEELDEYVPDFQVQIYDPATGVTTTETATVNWPNMPLAIHTGNRVFPNSRSFAYLRTTGITAVGDTLYHCVYSYGPDCVSGDLTKYPDCINVYFFRSDDYGLTWDYVSQINTIDEIYSATDNDCEGFNESALMGMPDGSVIVLLRSGSGKPMYIARSTDGCKTWSDPVKFSNVGVYPHMMQLECGVTVASYGRPGVFIRTTNDPAGMDWDDEIEIELSECPFDNPFLRDTCAYTDMLAIDDHTFLLVYSDFNYPNEDGEGRKTILVRTITVVPDGE